MKLLLENWRKFINEDIDTKFIVDIIQKYHEEGMGPIDLSEIEDPFELQILRAIYLYTSGEAHWKKVLDPSQPGIPDPIRSMRSKYVLEPTQEDYNNATQIIQHMGTLPNPFPENPIYRGIGRQLEQVKDMPVGQEIDLGVGSSWTNSERTAVNFAVSNLKGNNNTVVLFEIKNPRVGSPIYNISRTPDEKEVILGGKIKIIQKSEIIGDDAASKVVGYKSHLKNKWIPEPTFPNMDGKFFCIISCENI